MVAPSHSITVPHTVHATPIPVRQPLTAVIARRAMPLVAASASAALATLAAERAIAGLAMRVVERTGLARVQSAPEPAFTRITVTRTTVVERITRKG